MYNTTWGKEGGRGREETRLGRAVNWNGSAEGGVRAVESEMAHCESYLSCCLRIYGVRYTRIYIYIYLRGFAPIGRLSMVIGPWYSRAPYVKEYEASGGRKRGNLSSPSKSLSSWLERFAMLEAYVSLEGRRCCYLSAIDATTRFPLAFFFGRENRKGWKSFEQGTEVIFFFFSLGREGRALKSLMDHGMIWFENLKDGNFCKFFFYSIFHDF